MEKPEKNFVEKPNKKEESTKKVCILIYFYI